RFCRALNSCPEVRNQAPESQIYKSILEGAPFQALSSGLCQINGNPTFASNSAFFASNASNSRLAFSPVRTTSARISGPLAFGCEFDIETTAASLKPLRPSDRFIQCCWSGLVHLMKLFFSSMNCANPVQNRC